MRDQQHWLRWPYTVLITSQVLLSGLCVGQSSAPAPGPMTALLSTRSDWTDLREVVTQKPVTPDDLAVPATGVQIGVQLSGPGAVATDDVMEVIRSVLAQVLPVTYNDVDPQAYKNVTVCPANAPASAPTPTWQGYGPPSAHAPLAALNLPGSPGQHVGRRRLQAWRSLRQSADGVAATPDACEPKMRAVFMLRRTLGTDSSQENASSVQKTVRDAFNSGFMLARAKRSKLNIGAMDLLVYQNGGSSGVILPSSEASVIPGVTATSPSVAPAPAIQADARWSIEHPGSPSNGVTDVFFTLILTGQDAVETNAGMIKQLSYLLTDILNTGNVDYLTDDNTAVVDEHQLPPITPTNPGPGRKLLSSLQADEMGTEVVPLSESERRAMSAWLKRGRHSKRGDRAAHAEHARSRMRTLLQGPQPPQPPQPNQPPTGGPPITPAQLVYSGPVNALSIAYRVANIAQPGPAIIAEKLGYFIQTGQATQLMQQAGFRIGNMELSSFFPLPGVPTPAPAPLGAGLAGAQGAASVQPSSQANTANLKFVGKLLLGIILPVSILAIALAITFAYLFLKYKRRYADSEHPIKDSAQSMNDSGRKSFPHSSGSDGMRSMSSNQRSGSGGIRNIMENLSRNQDASGQEVLALASLAKKSLTLPGMQSDWEIDPDELEIARRPDGTEWRLGTGASAHVYKAFRNGVQVVAVKIFTDQVPGDNQLRYAEAFRREIFILRSCHDRNIVQFLGACLQVGQTILVQEYMENGDLFHAISEDLNGRFGWYRKKLPTGRPVPNTGMARRIALDTARGLFFLHSRKIVHFDLKSANVLLGRDWTAKIADVGLAKILKDGWLSTLREVGTFSWAAPEVLLGKPCTEKVDIYSYGVLLWELSAGEAPPGRNLRPLKVPEECPADVEAIIARCLDSDPEKRPSARELVEFMVQLPQQFSLNGTGADGSTELSSSNGSNGLSDNILTHGPSLPPMTPRPPPHGMVLPNAFGLLSMKSFKRSNSSKAPSTQDAGNAQPGAPAASGEAASAKPQKGGLSMPGSAFKTLKSMSFKRRQSQGGLETTVEESSGSIDRDLKEAVDKSNNSFRGAAEGRRSVVSPVEATGAAPTIRGEAAPRQPEVGSPRAVRFADGSAFNPMLSSTAPELNGGSAAARQGADCTTPALGRPMVRSAFTSRDSASEVQDAQSASMAERARQPVPPSGSTSASGEQGQAGSSPPKRAPPQKPWQLPFMSAFAAEEPDKASASLDEATQQAKDLPFASSMSAEPSAGSAAPKAPAAEQRRKPGRVIPSAFAAAEPYDEAEQETAAPASAPEQAPQRQQPRRPAVSAFAEAATAQETPAQPRTKPYLASAFANDDAAEDAPREQHRRAAPVAHSQSRGSGTGAAEGIEMSERGSPEQEFDAPAPQGRKAAPQLVKSPFDQEG